MVRTLLRVPTTNLPKSTVWGSWMLSKLTSYTFPWHDSVTLHFLPTLPLALDLTVSLAFMCGAAMPDISSSAPGDHKHCSDNIWHVGIKSEVNLFPNFIHSCNCTWQSKTIWILSQQVFFDITENFGQKYLCFTLEKCYGNVNLNNMSSFIWEALKDKL